MTKHLYIHIPFCKSICSFCDFCRKQISQDDEEIKKYVDKVISHVKEESYENQYISIYIGGGTPNYLDDKLLEKLLINLSKYLDKKKKYEFTIECNPEFITDTQAKIFKKFGVNRVSIGAQCTNNKILESINRKHKIEDVSEAIKILNQNGIDNISLDFIYALPNLTNKDLDNAIKFIQENNVKHVSFYALEVKEGSIFKKQKYVVDEESEADQLEYIIKKLNETNFVRYEVSNWSLNNEYQSIHNKAYWLTNDWKAIGFGASGFEENIMYKWDGDYLNWERVGHRLSTNELYMQVLMMGLRLVEGIEITKNQRNSEAYKTFFDDIAHCYIRDNHLICSNLNLLHETLLNIVDEAKEKQLENIKDKVYEE